MPDEVCAAFIAACSSVPEVESRWISVGNLSLCWELFHQFDDQENAQLVEPWRDLLFQEIERLVTEIGEESARPVMVDLDPPWHVTRGGIVLCRRYTGQYKEGGPMWVQVAESTGVLAFSSRSGTEYREFATGGYPIKIDGQGWPSAEHYYQAQKFTSKAYREKIRKADFVLAPRLVQDAGQKVRKDWDSVKADVLRAALWAKFSRHHELRELLLSTDDAELVDRDEAHAPDNNLLGRTLMEVRQWLRSGKKRQPKRRT
jgi:ribA/ribD-fused uncharacterized protein